jgi:hypothetical protein
MGILLPLLREKYRNPMLESEASTMEERIIDDVIPDEYITFLYDIMITFYHIYTVKIAKIQDDLSLWPSNITLINSIHTVAKTLYYDMAWTIFDMPLGKPQSIGDLCTNIIE